VLALTGMSVTGAAASTAGSQPGLATRVEHVDTNGVKATVTLRGGWRLGKSMPLTHLRAVKATSTAETYNWAGYVDTGHNVAFRFAAADFYAPNVQCNSSLVENGQSVVDYAVGLGGWNGSETGEQVGFQQDCNPSDTPDLTFASYYVIGDTGETITGAQPGDILAASVYYNPSGEYQLAVNDLTEPGGFSTTVSCPSTCDNTAAEVISNAFGSPSGYGLADYGAALFENAAVTSRAGTRGNLGASKLWSPTTVTAYDASSGDLLQSTGGLVGGSGFTETWKAVS
jgi:hypothetical protein